MGHNLFQEFYKFSHQKTPVYGTGVLLILMLYTAMMEGTDRNVIVIGFGMAQWIALILVVIGAAYFAMEYQYNTIVTLFYKSSHKYDIYIAKLIVIAVYDLFLLIFDTVLTFIFKVIMTSNRYHWITVFRDHHNLLHNFWSSTVSAWGLTMLTTAIVICLICLVRVNVVAIGLGLLTTFLGQGVSGALMSTSKYFAGLLKWGPLNMMNIVTQSTIPSYSRFTGLTMGQLAGGTIFYIFFFLLLGYFFFRRYRA